ncbi:MAG: hypothetical protein PVH00_15670 [Gemmatimonadota bacterium]|jgi:hypothetical protein
MRGPLVVVAGCIFAACGRAGISPPAPAVTHAGCYALDRGATAPPFGFPDTLELAAEWFVPDDSTGGRLRVVRPRDASLATYRRFGGRFWWVLADDSVVVIKSSGRTGVVLSLPVGDTVTGVVRTVGVDHGRTGYIDGWRIPCGP